MSTRFRGVRWLALVALVAGVVAVPSALAETAPGEAEAYSSGLWFVQMNGKPTAAGGSASAAAAEQAAFRAEAQKAGVSFTERYSFHGLWNGLSIRTGASESTLASIKGVKAVYPVLTAEIPPTETIDPELATALAMTGADIAQSSLGFTGEGIKVAVMDTGIDYDHADLGGDGGAETNSDDFPTARVTHGHDFVGDAFNANPASAGYQPVTTPDPRPDDCNGHGTHVSGIVGASGAVTGVAPDVTFGAYRVFGCDGSTTADIMIAAMEMAWQDDMDVLNMSIGSAFNTWPQYPTADAASALQNKGVVVVASIGNSGADGVYSAGAPGVGDNVIGVASYDNTFLNVNQATVTPAGLTVGYANMSGAPPPPPAPFSGSLPLALPTGNPNGCLAADYAGFPAGAAALIVRGGCTFAVKAQRAQAGGAAAAIVYNSSPGFFTGTVGAASGVTIYAVTISQADGQAIVAALGVGPQTWNWTAGTVSLPNPTGGTISSFSSFGLNAELTVKPDIGAPGGLIRSTYPLESGTYATISGTSMSSPHVAGAAALLLESNPNIPTDKVRDVLQNSADPKIRFGQAYLDNVHRQGAGMLDIDDSITATTWLKPGKISLGEGSGGTATIQLTNNSGAAVTYDVSHEPAAGTTGTFTPPPASSTNLLAYNTNYASASFSAATVVVPANGSASVSVTIDATAVPNKGVYGGYVKFTPQGGGQEYRVPYAGFKGDYQSIQVLTDGNGAGFPFLGKLIACPFPAGVGILRGSECFGGGNYDVPAGLEEYTLVEGLNETPFILAHFDHQARKFVADVYRASDDKWMGVGIMDEYLPRNSTATGFFPFAWFGDVAKGNNVQPAADGIYYFKVTVTKPLGNPTNTETWTSPDFEIDRP